MSDEKSRPAPSCNHPYAPEVWETIKTLWLSGKFASIEALHDHCVSIMGECPSLSRMEDVIHRERWNRFSLDELHEEKKKKSIDQLLDEVGLTEEKTMEHLEKIIMAPDDIQQVIIDMFKEFADKAEEKGNEKECKAIRAELKQMFDSRSRAFTNKLNAIGEVFKLRGNYAAEKKDHRIKTGSRTNVGKDPADMTIEEIENEIARMKNSGITGTILDDEKKEG